MTVDLQGKVALVTGGSRGIGKAIAIWLGEAGANVAVNYVRHQRAAWETIEAIENSGSQAVASLGSVRAIPNYSAVEASKAALESFVRHLAIELASKNINANVLSAGVVETDTLKHFPDGDKIVANSLAKPPAGRIVTPDDVAIVALFLVSSCADMIHRQTVVVDGGYSIVA